MRGTKTNDQIHSKSSQIMVFNNNEHYGSNISMAYVNRYLNDKHSGVYGLWNVGIDCRSSSIQHI